MRHWFLMQIPITVFLLKMGGSFQGGKKACSNGDLPLVDKNILLFIAQASYFNYQPAF